MHDIYNLHFTNNGDYKFFFFYNFFNAHTLLFVYFVIRILSTFQCTLTVYHMYGILSYILPYESKKDLKFRCDKIFHLDIFLFEEHNILILVIIF